MYQLTGDVDERAAGGGAGNQKREVSGTFSTTCSIFCKPKTALKNKIYLLKKKTRHQEPHSTRATCSPFDEYFRSRLLGDKGLGSELKLLAFK